MTKDEDKMRVLVLADPRAGTAAQALGIAERLGLPFETVALEWGPLARLPWPWPTLAGLTPAARARVEAAGRPALVISAGRRSAPVARWLARRGTRLVHAMRPGMGAGAFDMLVLPRHDRQAEAPNVVTVLGATHRLSPERLAAARAEWAELASLPAPRVVLLVGGAVKGGGLDPASVAALAGDAAAVLRLVATAHTASPDGDAERMIGGSILATTSRRTGEAASAALATALARAPVAAFRLFQWGDAGPNPYLGFLAWADAVVVTGDSVSMISEATAAGVPVFIAPLGGGARHAALARSLVEAGHARRLPLSAPAEPGGGAADSLDESGRVAGLIHARKWLD